MSDAQGPSDRKRKADGPRADRAGRESDDRSAGKRSKQSYSGNHYGRSDGQIKGPGIFVSCVRGRERKASQELLEFLEDIANQLYPSLVLEDEAGDEAHAAVAAWDEEIDEDALRNGASTSAAQSEAKSIAQARVDGDDIEAQIKAELDDMKGKPKKGRDGAKSGRQIRRFRAIMLDSECLFFIAVAKPMDPVRLTCALFDEIMTTGQARSRFIHRLSPVMDMVRAELDAVQALAERVIALQVPPADPAQPTTFKVDVKMRFHTRLAKMDIIHTLAACMPPHVRAQLNAPTFVLNVEVLRMHAGLAILPDYEKYRRYNPQSLAEQTKAAQQSTMDGDVQSRSTS